MERITDRQIATILAALRDFQQIKYVERAAAFPEHFEECSPLDDSEIDELCEQLNMGVLAADGGRSRSMMEIVTGY